MDKAQSPPQVSTIDRALRAGDVRAALSAADAWARAGNLSDREVAVEIAKAAGGVYRDFVTEPVHLFVENCEGSLPADVGPVVAKAVGRLVTMTRDWETRLRGCYEERLARELRDYVRVKEWQPALDNIALLAHVPGHEGDEGHAHERRVRYIGGVLGTCLNHPRESANLVSLVARDPAAYGLNDALASLMETARKERHDQMMRANVDNLENQWTVTLRGTQVEILNRMPGKNLMDEPSEEDLRDIGDLFRTVLRIPFWVDEQDMLLDATLVLVDFTPKDLGFAAKESGIEGRSYASLGFRAKKAVGMVFMDLGGRESFTGPWREWALANLDRSQAPQIIDFMGALRCEEFGPVLMQLWQDRRRRELKPELTMAIANLASPESADLLLEELRATLHKSVIGPPAVKMGTSLLEALGRIMRSPRTPEMTQRAILDRVEQLIPPENAKLAQSAVHRVYVAKPSLLSPTQRRTAIVAMVEALWIQDQKTEMHKGGERQANILGSRNAAIGALQRIGKNDFEFMLGEFEKRAMRFSGAYAAAAELFEKLKDPRAVPMLSNMLISAAMEDMSKLSTYQRETYWDAADQTRRELGKDEVMAPLVYALGELGGEDANRTLADLFERVQNAQVGNPGPETMNFLARAVEKVRGAEGRSDGGTTASARTQEAALPEADPEEVKGLVGKLTARYFLASSSKRAQAKIPALARLGALTPPRALDAIFSNLKEKDVMISSAAITAAAQFASSSKPATLVAAVVDMTLEGIESRDAAMRTACLKLLTEIGPNRPDVRKRVAAFAKIAEDGNVRLALKTALGEGRVGEAAGVENPAPDEAEASSGRGAAGATPSPVGGKSALDLKREYMMKRQAWVRGGKNGPPPEPPAGA